MTGRERRSQTAPAGATNAVAQCERSRDEIPVHPPCGAGCADGRLAGAASRFSSVAAPEPAAQRASAGDFYPANLDALLTPQLVDGKVTAALLKQGGQVLEGARQ